MISGLVITLAALVPTITIVDNRSTAEVESLCLAAVEGSASAEVECLNAIRKHADAMLVDELLPEFQSSCLVVDRLKQSELIWKYLEWLEEHPTSRDKPSATTINAAMLEKLPCGWRENS